MGNKPKKKNKDKRDQQKRAYEEKHKGGEDVFSVLHEDLKSKLALILNGAANIDGKTLKKETGLELKEIYRIHNTGTGYPSSLKSMSKFLNTVDLD